MFKDLKEDFNYYLKSIYIDDEINNMISYSLVNEGKRLRPLIMFSILLGYNYDPHNYFDIASAIEMVHTYSLVHDDLPSMDNDDYRHGKLSSHKKYGEGNAILVGDALLSDAFLQIANSKYINDYIKVILIKELSEAIGSKGMVRGQFYDLANDAQNSEKHHVLDINYLKTTKLLTLGAIFAVYITDNTSRLDDFLKVFDNLGLAFQIQDDILDVTSNFNELGKTPLKDTNSNKNTFINQFGLEKAKEKVEELFNNCFIILNRIPNFNKNYLEYLINLIKDRRK